MLVWGARYLVQLHLLRVCCAARAACWAGHAFNAAPLHAYALVRCSQVFVQPCVLCVPSRCMLPTLSWPLHMLLLCTGCHQPPPASIQRGGACCLQRGRPPADVPGGCAVCACARQPTTPPRLQPARGPCCACRGAACLPLEGWCSAMGPSVTHLQLLCCVGSRQLPGMLQRQRGRTAGAQDPHERLAACCWLVALAAGQAASACKMKWLLHGWSWWADVGEASATLHEPGTQNSC